MSANLYWEPVKRKKHAIDEGSPSSFMGDLEYAFGSRTPILNQNSIPILRGMAAADQYRRKNYQKLIEALEQYEEIEITAEY